MINRFKGDYAFLSNFASSFEIEIGGYVWPTVEHWYQANKALFIKDFYQILFAATPAEAKRLGKVITITPNFDTIKDHIMWIGIDAKFDIPEYKVDLLATGDQELIEGNDHFDTYWGYSFQKKTGLNKLGQLIMQKRAKLRNESTIIKTIPRVLNKKISGIPDGAVYIGRPTKWDNPFKVTSTCPRELSIKKFELYLLNNQELLRSLHELKGKDLVCYCAPLPCHGDVLLKYANQ